MYERTITVNKGCGICKKHETNECPLWKCYQNSAYDYGEIAIEYGLFCNLFELKENFKPLSDKQ